MRPNGALDDWVTSDSHHGVKLLPSVDMADYESLVGRSFGDTAIYVRACIQHVWRLNEFETASHTLLHVGKGDHGTLIRGLGIKPLRRTNGVSTTTQLLLYAAPNTDTSCKRRSLPFRIPVCLWSKEPQLQHHKHAADHRRYDFSIHACRVPTLTGRGLSNLE